GRRQRIRPLPRLVLAGGVLLEVRGFHLRFVDVVLAVPDPVDPLDVGTRASRCAVRDRAPPAVAHLLACDRHRFHQRLEVVHRGLELAGVLRLRHRGPTAPEPGWTASGQTVASPAGGDAGPARSVPAAGDGTPAPDDDGIRFGNALGPEGAPSGPAMPGPACEGPA